MLTKRKQQTEKRKGAGVISGKNIKVPHPHHKNKILKLLNELHTLSNAVNKKDFGSSPSLRCGDSEYAATSENED